MSQHSDEIPFRHMLDHAMEALDCRVGKDTPVGKRWELSQSS
jgi:hypothetical protein